MQGQIQEFFRGVRALEEAGLEEFSNRSFSAVGSNPARGRALSLM